MEDMDYLKKLQEAMMGQTPQREEYVTDPSLDIQEPQIPEQEIEQVNQEAKSPYLEESPERNPASDMQPEADMPTLDAPKTDDPMDPRAEYAKLIEQYKAKLAEPDKKKETGVMDWISSAGQIADVFNTNRGFQSMGNKPWQDTTVEKAKAKKKEELSGMQNLQKMYQNYMGLDKKKAEGKNIYKVGDQLVKIDEKGNAKVLHGKEKTKEDEPTFEQKEKVKEEVGLRKENIKTRNQAEKTVSDLDSQLEKIKRAKDLLQNLVKDTTISDTGPIDQYTSPLTSKGQKLRQSFNDLSLEKMSKLFQGMSKAVDSDAERKMFEQSQASMGNYPDVNMDVLNQMEKSILSLKNKNKQLLNRYDSKGNEVDQKPSEENSTGPYGDTVERNGKSYIWVPSAKKYRLM